MYAFSCKPTARRTAARVRLVRQRGLGRGARIRQQLLGGVGGGGGRRQRACRRLGASPFRASCGAPLKLAFTESGGGQLLLGALQRPHVGQVGEALAARVCS